jgi:hypothetical protein
VSLFLYRLKVNPRTLRILFRVSAVQAFACKAASIAGTVYVWAKVRRASPCTADTVADAPPLTVAAHCHGQPLPRLRRHLLRGDGECSVSAE